MTAALSLDPAVVDAQLAGPRDRKPLSLWHQRRGLGFGASDIPALLVGLGLRDPAMATKRTRDNAAIIRGTLGAPRIVAEKAGLKRPFASPGGGEREAELFAAWVRSLPDDGPLDASSAWHASVLPRRFWSPIRDPQCPHLAVSLDGGIDDVLGDEVVVEAKCGDPERDGPAWPKDGSCPWFWRTQVQAQLAATGCSMGVLVCGVGWAYRDAAPIVVWPIERDEDEIAEIREAVVRGWSMVEKVRGGSHVEAGS